MSYRPRLDLIAEWSVEGMIAGWWVLSQSASTLASHNEGPLRKAHKSVVRRNSSKVP